MATCPRYHRYSLFTVALFMFVVLRISFLYERSRGGFFCYFLFCFPFFFPSVCVCVGLHSLYCISLY